MTLEYYEITQAANVGQSVTWQHCVGYKTSARGRGQPTSRAPGRDGSRKAAGKWGGTINAQDAATSPAPAGRSDTLCEDHDLIGEMMTRMAGFPFW